MPNTLLQAGVPCCTADSSVDHDGDSYHRRRHPRGMHLPIPVPQNYIRVHVRLADRVLFMCSTHWLSRLDVYYCIGVESWFVCDFAHRYSYAPLALKNSSCSCAHVAIVPGRFSDGMSHLCCPWLSTWGVCKSEAGVQPWVLGWLNF